MDVRESAELWDWYEPVIYKLAPLIIKKKSILEEQIREQVDVSTT